MSDLINLSAPPSPPARPAAHAGHAFVLAGGQGVRLRPYTTVIPKPLVPVGDEMSIIEILLRQLAGQGFSGVTIALGHLGSLIQAYVGDGSQWGIEVAYTVEAAPLGTVGPALLALDRLPEHFLIVNGDLLTDIDYADLLASHQLSGAALTVATHTRSQAIDFGVLDILDNRIVGFSEKPAVRYAVSMGVYAASRRCLEGYRPGQALGVDRLVLDLIDRGRPPHSYPFDGFWLDIGRPEDYDRANRDFPVLRSILLPEPDASCTAARG